MCIKIWTNFFIQNGVSKWPILYIDQKVVSHIDHSHSKIVSSVFSLKLKKTTYQHKSGLDSYKDLTTVGDSFCGNLQLVIYLHLKTTFRILFAKQKSLKMFSNLSQQFFLQNFHSHIIILFWHTLDYFDFSLYSL